MGLKGEDFRVFSPGLVAMSAAVMLAFVFSGPGTSHGQEIEHFCYRVVKEYPHDPRAFTQGLVFSGVLFEGTGLRGRSSVREVDLTSGRVKEIRRLAPSYFGEGITVLNGKIIQLTWQSRIGFVYDEHTFKLLRTFTYPTEGWGLTHDSEHLIMSDGSDTLYFLDPSSYTCVRQVRVQDAAGPVRKLNELEYIKGKVYANVWQTDRIVVIDPDSGRVDAWVDLKGLLQPKDRRRPVDVLNGIAYDPETERIWVTGKLWPKLFEIELIACP
jgi:glutamine cyclotransferase